MNIVSISFKSNNYNNYDSNNNKPNIPPYKGDTFEKSTNIDMTMITRAIGISEAAKMGYNKEDIQRLKYLANQLNQQYGRDNNIKQDSMTDIIIAQKKYNFSDVNQLIAFSILDKALEGIPQDKVDKYVRNSDFTNKFLEIIQFDNPKIPLPDDLTIIDIYNFMVYSDINEKKLQSMLEIYENIKNTYDENDLFCDWVEKIAEYMADENHAEKYIEKKDIAHSLDIAKADKLHLGPMIYFAI